MLRSNDRRKSREEQDDRGAGGGGLELGMEIETMKRPFRRRERAGGRAGGGGGRTGDAPNAKTERAVVARDRDGFRVQPAHDLMIMHANVQSLRDAT